MTTRVLIDDRQRTHKLDLNALESWLSDAARLLWDGDRELSVLLLGRRRMAELNRQARQTLGPTDIISFPQTSPDSPETPLLGDLVVCPDVVLKQAAQPLPDQSLRTPNEELSHVLIHGLLHLAGHTHDTPANTKKMKTEEQILLKKLPQVSLF